MSYSVEFFIRALWWLYVEHVTCEKFSKEIKICPWLKIKEPKITYPFHSFLSSPAHHLRRPVYSVRLSIYKWHFQILDLYMYFMVVLTSRTSKVQQIRGDFSTL